MKEISVLSIKEGTPLSAYINPELAHKEAHKMREAGIEVSVTVVSISDYYESKTSTDRFIETVISIMDENKEGFTIGSLIIIFLLIGTIICV